MVIHQLSPLLQLNETGRKLLFRDKKLCVSLLPVLCPLSPPPVDHFVCVIAAASV